MGAILACSHAFGAYGQTAPGELRIDGGPVEWLTLLDEDGRQQRFDHPGKSIPLPGGTYRLHEAALEGGYVCRSHLTPAERRIFIESGRSTVLALGAPLRQTIRVERWGTLLILNYDLLGRQGERYTVREDEERPAFAAFQGNDAVLSGRFDLEPGGTYSYVWRVPLTASGRLRILPSHDLHALGPSEGEATLYTWRWFRCVPGLPLWSALILAVVLTRANRTLRSLPILALVIVVYAGWSALAGTLPLDSLEHETSGIMILSLAVALALWWLIGRPLADATWLRSLRLALAVAMGTILLGAASLGPALSDRMIRFVAVTGVLMSAAAVGHVLACRTCRRQRRAWRFGLSLGAGTIAASIVGMLVMITTWCTTYGGWLGDADYILWLTFVLAPSLGAGVFMVSLPFALLGLKTCFPLTLPREPAAGS